ncbi:hypothetical protein DV735_g5411, partial [Chaetothyriales sp. CBS 134920]
MRRAKGARARAQFPSRSFIVDNGAYSIKAGFAPDEQETDEQTLSKCHVVPNAIVKTRDRKTYIASRMDRDVTQWSEAVFRRPVEHGQVVSWEAQKEIWDFSFFNTKTAHKDLLITNPEDTTFIFAEHPNTLHALQKNADEIIMEEWGFGGYMRSLAPSLNAYNDLHPLFEESQSNPPHEQSDLPMDCLLVIDSGYSSTTIVPTFKGRPLQRAIRRLDFGGKHLTNLLKETISVRYFDLHQDTKIVNDVKEDVCFASLDFKEDMEKARKAAKAQRRAAVDTEDEDEMQIDTLAEDDPRIDYVLPDGINVLRGFSRPHDPSIAAERKRKLNALTSESEISMTLNNERFTIPEIIFTPSDIGSKQPGLADCVMQSLAVLPPLIQATLLSNVLVVGGNANIPGFVDRIQQELRSRVRSEWAVRVRKPAESITSSWLGGARLASRHPQTVREYGITKEEYYEHGSAWVARKFLHGSEVSNATIELWSYYLNKFPFSGPEWSVAPEQSPDETRRRVDLVIKCLDDKNNNIRVLCFIEAKVHNARLSQAKLVEKQAIDACERYVQTYDQVNLYVMTIIGTKARPWTYERGDSQLAPIDPEDMHSEDPRQDYIEMHSSDGNKIASAFERMKTILPVTMAPVAQ